MNLVCPNCGGSASVPLEMSGYCRDHRPRLVPERIQLRRSRGWRKPEGAVVVARPSRWGNPFRIAEDPRRRGWCVFDAEGVIYYGYSKAAAQQEAVGLFEANTVTLDHLEDLDEWLAPLRGRDLACWCPLEDDHGRRAPCHADVLLLLANPEVSFAWAK